MKKISTIISIIFFNTIFFSHYSYGQCSCNTLVGGAQNLDLYWVGDVDNNYNNPCNWRVGAFSNTDVPCQAPRSNDNVFFSAAAFASPNKVVHIDQNSNCKNMLWDNAILPANKPQLTSASTAVNLNIFGNLTLTDIGKMDVNFNGNLTFFGTGANVYTLDTRGHNLKLQSFLISLDPIAELRLLSDLVLNNINNNNHNYSYSLRGGIIEHQEGHFNTNGQTVNADGLRSYIGSSRKLTLDNSSIHLRVAGWYPGLFNLNNFSPASNLSATGSHIHLETASQWGLTEITTFQSTLVFDSISLNLGYAHRNLSGKINCNYLSIASNSVLQNANFSCNTLVLHNGTMLFSGASRVLEFDNFFGPTGCSEYAYIQGLSPTSPIVIRKKTAGTLALNNLILSRVSGDIGAGSSYIATNSKDAGNNTNISISTPTGCPSDLYFRPTSTTAPTAWNDPANWFNSAGIAANQVPSPFTNVHFDAASGTNVTLNTIVGNCNNMNWTTVPTNFKMIVYYPLGVMGNVNLTNNGGAEILGGTAGYLLIRGLHLYGNSNTFTSNTVPVKTGIAFSPSADYTFADSLYGNQIKMQSGSTIRTQNIGMSISHLWGVANRYMDNTQVHFRGTGWPICYQSGSSVVAYTGNTSFHFDHSGGGAKTISGHLPNVYIADGARDVRLAGRIEGDLHFLGDAQLYRPGSYNTTTLTVDSSVYIATGATLSTRGGTLNIGQNLNASGDCRNYGLIQSDIGTTNIKVDGVANVNNVAFNNINQTGVNPINVVNCVDAGGNSGINFSTATVSQTYYWRAHSSDPTDFVGNWSDPGHWTTSIGNTQGDSLCIPTLADNVIFDVNSSSATSNGCTIDGSAFCNNLLASNGIVLSAAFLQKLYVGGDFILDNSASAVNINNLIGTIFLVGGGNINTDGSNLRVKELVLDSEGNTFNLLNPIYLAQTATNNYSGILRLNAGSFNSNGHNISIENAFLSMSNKTRAFDFSNSTIFLSMKSYYRNSSGVIHFPWRIDNTTSFTLQAGDLDIDGSPITSSMDVQFYLGDDLSYQLFHIYNTTQTIQLRGNNAHIQYADLATNVNIKNNMEVDSISVYGGNTYLLDNNLTLELTAPHGKIISRNVGPGSFVTIENNAAANVGLSYIHKEYGNSFCINYVKVRDVKATKAATQPAACTQPDCWSLLAIETDQNSDSISIKNNDWGIWQFKLPPLVNPTSFGADTVIICKTGSNLFYPIQITGTSPYIIDYNWVDATNPATSGGQSGIVVYDNDNNPNTPYTYNVPLNPIVNSFDYTVEIATSRCGERILSTPVQTHVVIPVSNPLVANNRTGSCTFYNEGEWYAILDDIDERPIVSLLDSTLSPDSLELVNTEVFFEPTVQTLVYNGLVYPYLQRHWQITPTNNTMTKVRLYFTQQELTALGANTFAGIYNGGLDVATELKVLKYRDGTFLTSTTSPDVVEVPFSVVAKDAADWAANPNAATPFSTTTDLIAIEFEVNSFSHFAIVTTQDALLDNSNLLSFTAQLHQKGSTKLDWTVERMDQVASFVVEHTTNYQNINQLGEVSPVQGKLSYRFMDNKPYVGENYYRIKTIDRDGSVHYSAWKVVHITSDARPVLYPNPTHDHLNVQLYLEEITTLKWSVTDLLGRTILQQETSTNTGIQTFGISTQNLSNGTYILKIENTQTGAITQHQFVKR
ncbi:T9SS type A sorting domain-containing protein [Aureispira anguillae]|uniref:T9SS type A sorting domain-containing protein n=1 Tax=Aureispira anguillae TaxID=2864201 RepID=A0A915YBD8_9BACT|nr:T9SS type A sorting domain-containing protein [Aureispira anguillae]BDS09962.1 T9SS type A sorting domain-containing protein [Aureispira anguillae]